MTSPETLHLADDGAFPNNRLPVLIWRQGIPVSDRNGAETIERAFRDHGWEGTWRDGIFDFHHFHSDAHEVLGIARGSVTVQLGGPNGETVELAAGDIVLLPAGTAHRNLGQSRDLLVIGAYPPGQRPDMRYGDPAERPDIDERIDAVPLPGTNPVTVEPGPPEAWREDVSR
jgi:uncharacterized protein YjlB